MSDVSLSVPYGWRQAIIGPNGAGKSTLFSLIAGGLRTDSGRILLDGMDVTRLPEHRRVRGGMTRVFQRPRVFRSMTVSDNLRLAHPGRPGDWLERVGLADRAGERAGVLSYGEQRRLEVAMALATRPRLLLLDEPTAGLTAEERDDLIALITTAEATVLIIEHDLDLVFDVATHVCVMDLGRVLVAGTPQEVQASAEFHEVYPR